MTAALAGSRFAAGALTAALLAAAALAPAGCGSQKREECRSLTSLINAGAEGVEKVQASALDPAGLKSVATVLEKSAGDAEALKLTDAALQKQAKDYAALMRAVAKEAREMAAAAENGDLEKAKAANAAMEKLVGDEPRVIGEVNKVCTAE